MEQCTVDGCEHPAANGRPKCWGCYSSSSRNGTTTRKRPQNGVRHATPKAMVQEAIEAYNNAECETDPRIERAAEVRAWARLRTAWRRYFRKTAGLNTANKRTKTPT